MSSNAERQQGDGQTSEGGGSNISMTEINTGSHTRSPDQNPQQKRRRPNDFLDEMVARMAIPPPSSLRALDMRESAHSQPGSSRRSSSPGH